MTAPNLGRSKGRRTASGRHGNLVTLLSILAGAAILVAALLFVATGYTSRAIEPAPNGAASHRSDTMAADIELTEPPVSPGRESTSPRTPTRLSESQGTIERFPKDSVGAMLCEFHGLSADELLGHVSGIDPYESLDASGLIPWEVAAPDIEEDLLELSEDLRAFLEDKIFPESDLATWTHSCCRTLEAASMEVDVVRGASRELDAYLDLAARDLQGVLTDKILRQDFERMPLVSWTASKGDRGDRLINVYTSSNTWVLRITAYGYEAPLAKSYLDLAEELRAVVEAGIPVQY